MMMNSPRKRSILILSVLALFVGALVVPRFSSCTPDNNGNGGCDTCGTVNVPKVPRVAGPIFNFDSAYSYIEQQVAFGPRVPGTPEHDSCGKWIVKKMESFGLTVTEQQSPATLYTGKTVTMTNIMAQYMPERTDRILLVAHWDTRHIADRDDSLIDKPIDGANDGGSGVAVLMEIGRIIGEKDPGIGVDFLFVDAEDHGQPGGAEETWCLGSQYWAQRVTPEYAKTVHFGILLDMVGGKNAIFPREGTSVRYESGAVSKVWNAAHDLGYKQLFSNSVTGETVDDNRFINVYARIPCINIVHYDPAEGDYGPTHHRHTDNMDNIDKGTLDAVGKVVVDVLYNEMPPKS